VALFDCVWFVSTALTSVERRVSIFTVGFDASVVMARFTEIEVKRREELVFLVPAIVAVVDNESR
jgi:hypothetical protein